MKAHLTKVSLALLSAALVLGCQDLGSGPVGPDGPQFDKPVAGNPNCVDPISGHCHGDDGDTGGNTNTGSIALTGGMDGTTGSSKIGDTSKKFTIYAPVATDITIDLQATACVVTRNPDGNNVRANFLTALLTDGTVIASGFIGVGVDKTAFGDSSDKHNLIANASFPGVGGVRIGIPRFLEPTVTQGNGSFVFSGKARAVAYDGPPGDAVVVVCDNSNSVTVTPIPD